MEHLENFFWIDMCNYVGALTRSFLNKELRFKTLVRDEDELRKNLVWGNAILIPLLLAIVYLGFG